MTAKLFIVRFVWNLNVLFETFFKNHRNVKLPAIRQHAINVAAMRETLETRDAQIWNRKCIITWCKPQARPKTRASILHMHACVWSLSAACLGLNRHYTHKNRIKYVKFQLQAHDCLCFTAQLQLRLKMFNDPSTFRRRREDLTPFVAPFLWIKGASGTAIC